MSNLQPAPVSIPDPNVRRVPAPLTLILCALEAAAAMDRLARK